MSPEARGGFTLSGSRALGCLLVHGLTATAEEMRPLGEALAARGFPVHAVCLAGHGTDLASLARARWADWFASVSEGLARLRPEAPRIAVAGMSLGGLLALHLAATHPAAVAALVLCGTPIQLSGARFRWLPILARLPFVARRYATIPKVNGKPDIADPVMRAASQSYPAVPLPAVLELLRSELGSRSIETHVLERSWHVVTLDYDRDEVARLAAAFLDRVAAEAAPAGRPA